MKKVLLYIDCQPGSGGIFQYSQAILQAALSLPKGRFEVTALYADKSWQPYMRGVTNAIHVPFGRISRHVLQAMLGSPLPLSWLRFLFRLHPVASAIRARDPELCIFPSQESFWGYVTKSRSIWAIHDLMHRYERQFPEVAAFGRARHRDRHFVRVCRNARAIFVDSEIGRHHVHDAYGFPMEAIHCLPYIAPPHVWNPRSRSRPVDRYRLPERFIFYPAQFWAHKNHLRLVEAVRRLREQIPDICLVLAGSRKNAYEAVARKVSDDGLEDVVKFIGFVPDDALAEIYRRAVALVLPTFFGPTNIPPLEAFALGCPVAVSKIYGMEEQLGDAALYFDPLSVDDIANVIKRLWTDIDLRDRLRLRGLVHSENWGPAQFNQRFVGIIAKVLDESTPQFEEDGAGTSDMQKS